MKKKETIKGRIRDAFITVAAFSILPAIMVPVWVDMEAVRNLPLDQKISLLDAGKAFLECYEGDGWLSHYTDWTERPELRDTLIADLKTGQCHIRRSHSSESRSATPCPRAGG